MYNTKGYKHFISIPIPDKDQLYMLAGGYITTSIKDIKKLPDNVVAAANTYLENIAKTNTNKK